ncbi:hypothetical protein PV10_00086 [Exophiala mesophila]|uniref:Ras-GAP domain-containing protein n=1 Tax=Exophiala mesophila TaxID=212818 RepID=A0A0D1X340_EXOME|nr:uncharacterized protein PV10_00086 [Exophiala mesophila]KIV96190.1 hypothetical protein PV10_00086 [Exophiala mesophila]
MNQSEREETRNATASRSRAQNIQRRTSHHASPHDRHGMVFDLASHSTIRAVTPESQSFIMSGSFADSVDSTLLHSPASQSSRKNGSQRRREKSTSVSNTDEEGTIERRRRRTQSRANTSDDLPLDTSPGSFITKTRKRLGSITTTGNLLQRDPDSHGSIGFPSVVQSPDLQDQRDPRDPPRTPRRPFSPENGIAAPTSSIRSPRLLDIDSAKILHLMKTTCGRMHGILFFRQLHTTAWESGYCAINVAPGSLVCQTKGEVSQSKTLISDLRGCTVRTHYDHDSQSTYLSVLIASSGSGYQLRPPVPETFDSWLAALLCWQPLRPKGVHIKSAKPQPVSMPHPVPAYDKKAVSQRRVSDISNVKSAAIIKVGKLMLWDGPLPSGSQLGTYSRGVFRSTRPELLLWRKASCTLHDNGLFRLLDQLDARVIFSIQLSHLSRCAVQRLDQSVLQMPHCIAIYPHHTIHSQTLPFSRPVVLCLETSIAFQAWFVLLRAFTQPELYGSQHQLADTEQAGRDDGPAPDSQPWASELFRMERTLSLKITEAKFGQKISSRELSEQTKSKGRVSKQERGKESVYAEVMLGKDLRARTSPQLSVDKAFWAEEFVLEDISTTLSNICIAVKVANPAEKEWTMVADGLYDISTDTGYLSGLGGLEISSHDPIFGRVDLSVDELESQGTLDKWFVLLDNNEHHVGQILIRFTLHESVILMEHEYRNLSSMLQNFSNGLTTQITGFLAMDLRQVSDILLDIFQASGTVLEWLSHLVEEEIDGTYKEVPTTRMRFSNRIQSNDSYESAEQREMFVRDLSRSATMEANLLFRGNSLVTKALDAHMRRLGKSYLEDVLGEKLRTIMERDPDCEVDPNRVRSQEQLDKNWANLNYLTSTVWKAIAVSASLCPVELRLIFRHIRSCAEDRYGSFIRTVKYTSVSGFLFLRFFCPAILNPKLFGLIHDFPPERTKRTFTLIAKSLNVLANMAKFGTKEPWMAPMNKFLSTSSLDFKAFIDEICAVSSSQMVATQLEPQFAAPNQIRSRLPPLSREGLPSLPFLLDRAKLLAQLVDFWVSHAPENTSEIVTDEIMVAFHTTCAKLSQKSRACLRAAEQAERPADPADPTWQRGLGEQPRNMVNSPFEDSLVRPSADNEITALPQTMDTLAEMAYKASEASPVVGEGDTTPSSSASAAWDRKIPFPQRGPEARAMTNSTNSSTLSLDAAEDARARPLPSSRDGPSKNRLFDLMGSSGRRKGKGGERNHAEDDGQ